MAFETSPVLYSLLWLSGKASGVTYVLNGTTIIVDETSHVAKGLVQCPCYALGTTSGAVVFIVLSSMMAFHFRTSEVCSARGRNPIDVLGWH